MDSLEEVHTASAITRAHFKHRLFYKEISAAIPAATMPKVHFGVFACRATLAELAAAVVLVALVVLEPVMLAAPMAAQSSDVTVTFV